MALKDSYLLRLSDISAFVNNKDAEESDFLDLKARYNRGFHSDVGDTLRLDINLYIRCHEGSPDVRNAYARIEKAVALSPT